MSADCCAFNCTNRNSYRQANEDNGILSISPRYPQHGDHRVVTIDYYKVASPYV